VYLCGDIFTDGILSFVEYLEQGRGNKSRLIEKLFIGITTFY
jgi:hypothetical protein